MWEDPERGDLTKNEAAALARPVRSAERALYGPGGWRKYIDPASAADFALLNEPFKNEDAFHASTYMSLHADGRLRLGPLWDFDIAIGNSTHHTHLLDCAHAPPSRRRLHQRQHLALDAGPDTYRSSA